MGFVVNGTELELAVAAELVCKACGWTGDSFGLVSSPRLQCQNDQCGNIWLQEQGKGKQGTICPACDTRGGQKLEETGICPACKNPEQLPVLQEKPGCPLCSNPAPVFEAAAAFNAHLQEKHDLQILPEWDAGETANKVKVFRNDLAGTVALEIYAGTARNTAHCISCNAWYDKDQVHTCFAFAQQFTEQFTGKTAAEKPEQESSPVVDS